MNNLDKYFYNVITTIWKNQNLKKDHHHLIMKIKKMYIIQESSNINPRMTWMTICQISNMPREDD